MALHFPKLCQQKKKKTKKKKGESADGLVTATRHHADVVFVILVPLKCLFTFGISLMSDKMCFWQIDRNHNLAGWLLLNQFSRFGGVLAVNSQLCFSVWRTRESAVNTNRFTLYITKGRCLKIYHHQYYWNVAIDQHLFIISFIATKRRYKGAQQDCIVVMILVTIFF